MKCRLNHEKYKIGVTIIRIRLPIKKIPNPFTNVVNSTCSPPEWPIPFNMEEIVHKSGNPKNHNL